MFDAVFLAAVDGIWPTTMMGWVALIGGTTALVISVSSWVLQRDRRVRTEARHEARVGRVAHDCEQHINQFRAAMEATLNGFGVRLSRVETTSDEDHSIVNGVLQTLAENRASQAYVRETLLRIEKALDTLMHK